MERRVKIIEHRGRFIFYGDYSGLQWDDFLNWIEQLEKLSMKYSRQEILHLLNFTDCAMGSEAKERVDRMVRKLTEEGSTIRTACFGVRGLQRIFANMGKRGIYFAKSEREAKDWLVRNT
jgi:hypothetical protein